MSSDLLQINYAKGNHNVKVGQTELFSEQNKDTNLPHATVKTPQSEAVIHR